MDLPLIHALHLVGDWLHTSFESEKAEQKERKESNDNSSDI
jgi:hypothetical protein